MDEGMDANKQIDAELVAKHSAMWLIWQYFGFQHNGTEQKEVQ